MNTETFGYSVDFSVLHDKQIEAIYAIMNRSKEFGLILEVVNPNNTVLADEVVITGMGYEAEPKCVCCQCLRNYL
jgi:hypothetical protein